MLKKERENYFDKNQVIAESKDRANERFMLFRGEGEGSKNLQTEQIHKPQTRKPMKNFKVRNCCGLRASE